MGGISAIDKMKGNQRACSLDKGPSERQRKMHITNESYGETKPHQIFKA